MWSVQPAFAAMAVALLMASCASDDVVENDSAEATIEDDAAAILDEPEPEPAPAPPIDPDELREAMLVKVLPPAFVIATDGQIRDADGATVYTPGAATTDLVAALPNAGTAADGDELPVRAVDVKAGAPGASVITLVQTCHAPEAPHCVVRLFFADTTHDVARPEPPTSGPFAELPVVLRFDEPFARITSPAGGGTGWVRVPSDATSLTAAMREESQRNETTRVILSFPNDVAAEVVSRTLRAIQLAGYDDVTFAGTF